MKKETTTSKDMSSGVVTASENYMAEYWRKWLAKV